MNAVGDFGERRFRDIEKTQSIALVTTAVAFGDVRGD